MYLIELVLAFSNSSDKYPEVELLNHMVVYFQFFEGPPYCFSQCTQQFIFLPAVHKGSLFPTSSATLLISWPFDNSHSKRCEVIISLGFDLHFSDNGDVQHLFMHLWPSACLHWKNVYSDPLPIFIHVVCGFLLLSCMIYLYILDINPLSDT